MTRATDRCSCATRNGFQAGTTGRASVFTPEVWWPGHIQPPRTSFISPWNADPGEGS